MEEHLPYATGIKLANPNKKVIVVGGDGDGLAIGGNHTIHASRRNIDLNYIIINNFIYGLTNSQTSLQLQKVCGLLQ
jgi:2-oxoglutarate ferredoxin oxidoreductase subunit beta